MEHALYLSDVSVGSVSGESGTMYVLVEDGKRADRLESVVYKVLDNKLVKVFDAADVSAVVGIEFNVDSKFLAVTHDEGTNKTYVIAQLKPTANEYYLTATDLHGRLFSLRECFRFCGTDYFVIPE